MPPKSQDRPKVIFGIPCKRKEARLLLRFCMPNKSGWERKKYIFEVHPVLKKQIGRSEITQSSFPIFYKYSKNFYKDNKKLINKNLSNYKREWGSIENDYLNLLQNILEIDWPKRKKILKAYLSISPIYPRDLNSWSFHVPFNDVNMMRMVCAHEILHFIYFLKWKEIFPKSNEKNFQMPHLVWKLSEILAPVIINNTLEIQKLIKYRDNGYSAFRKIMIKNNTVLDHFARIYKDHSKKKASFEDFLKISWKEARKHEKKLEEF
jgi:hypothetical protein